LDCFDQQKHHLQLTDLLEQHCFLSLALNFALDRVCSSEQLTATFKELSYALGAVDRMDGVVSSNLLDRLAPLVASMATLALNSGLRVRHFLVGGSQFQGR